MQLRDRPAQTATLRRQMLELLSGATLTAKELSGLLALPEREVYGHLEHLRRSLQGSGRDLAIIPARCLKCDFEFSNRQRLKKPGRCPRCRASHISEPLFTIG